ncbi:MAG: DUF362 domain-containing protein [Nitrospiraceae bacterium]|nr:MAG: DUF362 domain-containing protein [Nitrospiraceae bacterium]
MLSNLTRRMFLAFSAMAALALYFKRYPKDLFAAERVNTGVKAHNPGASHDGKSYVYLAKGASSEDNMRKVVEMMGGINKFVGADDIVLLKPNAQWWNQGTTNTNAMKAFIEMVLASPNFKGEIIIAENHHFPEDNSRGWTTDKRNGDHNLNELVEHFQKSGRPNVTKYHWHDGGGSVPGMWGGAEKGGLVKGPGNGDGYVWRDDLVFTAPGGKKAMMSYPVFTSEYSGITIDFCKGPWKNGMYLDRKLKFVNFAGLNHHSSTGVTASIKNYLGICDMTCGHRGRQPEGFYNLHFIGESNLHWRIKEVLGKFGWKEYLTAIGGAVGYFMKNVRMADLNIITAEWTGYGSRTDTNLREHTRAVLASADPVALDYAAAKDILMPATVKNSKSSSLRLENDPEPDDSPFRKFLSGCHDMGIGNLREDRIVRVKDI